MRAGSGGRTAQGERRRRYRLGLRAEVIAALALRLRGYRILARRYKTHAGEIDLITLRSGRIGFVEVKRRADRQACIAAVTGKTRDRVRHAANLWLARHPRHQGSDVGFDLVFVQPRRWPEFLKDAL